MVIEEKLREEIAGLIGGCFRQPSGVPIWEWATEEVYLPPKATETPGYYDWKRTPYTRVVNDWFQEDDDHHEMWVKKSSRSGFTEAALNNVRWMPENRPGRVAYGIESDKKARDVMRMRLLPTIARVAEAQLTDNKDDQGSLLLNLRNMVVEAHGCGSESPFTEKQLLYAVLDEIEVHPLNFNSKASGTTDQLMRSRFPTAPGWKMLVMSKPKLVGGIVDVGHSEGTCEVYEVPCPECGEFQELEFDQLKFGHCRDLTGEWDNQRILAETFYLCRNARCGAHLSWHEHLYEMNLGGRWRVTNENPAEPDRRSIHISDLYSPYEATSWPRLALAWANACGKSGSQGKRQFFVNNHLGLGYEPRTVDRTEEDLRALCAGWQDPESGQRFGEPYELGQTAAGRRLPIEPALLAVAIDVQMGGALLKFAVGCFDPFGAVYLVDYGAVGGNAELEAEVLERDYAVQGAAERTFRPALGWRDSGDKKTEQVRWCLDTFERYHVWPCRGLGSGDRGSPVWLKNEEMDGRNVELYYYRDKLLKDELYIDRIAERGEPRLWLPSDIDAHPGLMYEILSEKRVLKHSNNGFPYWDYELKPGASNDYGDCLKMLLGIWHVVGAKVTRKYREGKAAEKKEEEEENAKDMP